MWNARLDELQAGIKTVGKIFTTSDNADDTTLMGERQEELKSLLMWLKEESEKAGLKLNTRKTQNMASGPITSRKLNQSILRAINPEYSLEGLMLKLKLQYFGHLIKRRLIGKVPDAEKDWGQKEKKASEDEIAGRHHRCSKHELGQTLGDGKGQGGLACCSPQGRRVRNDWVTEQHQQPIPSWQIDEEKVEAMIDFIFLGSKITVDIDCSHEIKKHLLYTSVSLLLSRIQGYCYHLSKFYIYALVYCIGVFLSGLLHSVL